MPYKDKEKQRMASRQHYLKNKQDYSDRTKKRRKRNRDYILSTKDNCSRCEETDKYCLDYHHLYDKKYELAELVIRASSFDEIDDEISKCELICANCHAKEHNPLVIKDGISWGFNPARVKKRQWFIDFIVQQKCNRCDETDSRCLHFHHTQEKRHSVAKLLSSGHSLKYLQEEIARCEILCANCHRKHHTQ